MAATEKDPLFYDKHGKILQEVWKKLVAANRSVGVPEFCYSFVRVNVQLEKNRPLGLFLKQNTVHGVRTNGPFQGLLQTGDIILQLNGVSAPLEHRDIFRLLTAKLPAKFHIAVGRLNRNMRLKPDPNEYEKDEACILEYKIMYFMRGMRLGLDLREIDEKIIVIGCTPDSISSMALKEGERILEAEGQKAVDAVQTQKAIETALAKKGYCRVCVHVPVQDWLKNELRAKIASYYFPPETKPKNYELPREIRPLVDVGIKALMDCKEEPKSIYKKESTLKKRAEAKETRISFNQKVTEQGVIMEAPSRLMVKVPPPKARP